MRLVLGMTALLFMLMVACGDSDAPPTATPDGSAVSIGGSAAMGPGLSVGEALTTTAEGPLLVRGFLVARDGTVRLCEALAESYPPQCGGASLTVTGLDLAQRTDIQQAEGVSWTDAEVFLLGAVEDGTLTVDPHASA